MNDKRLQVNLITRHDLMVDESPQLDRGLELLGRLDFTSIIPAAILTHNNQLLLVEDAAFIRDSYEPYWDDEHPRVFAVHRFSLDRREYYSTSVFELPRLHEQVARRCFVIAEDHLVVQELYLRDPDSPSSYWDMPWADHLFKFDGELVTVLAEDSIVLNTCWHNNVPAKAVRFSDSRFKPWKGVASKPLARMSQVGEHLEIDDLIDGYIDGSLSRTWESLPYTDAKDVFRRLQNNPAAREIIIRPVPHSDFETYRKSVYPDQAFWDFDSGGEVSVLLGNLQLTADFQSVLTEDAPGGYGYIYGFRNEIKGDSEIIIGCVDEPGAYWPRHFTYCWIEKGEIKAIHFLQPEKEIEKLNREGSVRFTLRDIFYDSIIHHDIMYIICDEEYSKTSAIMAFDVRTSAVTPILPRVPKNMSVMHRQF